MKIRFTKIILIEKESTVLTGDVTVLRFPNVTFSYIDVLFVNPYCFQSSGIA